MIVESAVGGTFELMDLGVAFQAGETIDLSFLATEAQILASKELRRALERGHLKRSSSALVVPSNFLAFESRMIPVAVPNDSVRRALFIDTPVPSKGVSYGFYAMRDMPTRRSIAASTHDAELLEAIIENEVDAAIVATSKGRLARLY